MPSERTEATSPREKSSERRACHVIHERGTRTIDFGAEIGGYDKRRGWFQR